MYVVIIIIRMQMVNNTMNVVNTINVVNTYRCDKKNSDYIFRLFTLSD